MERLISKPTFHQTNQQKEAFEEFVHWFEMSDDPFFGLFGHAGTGKTTVAARMVRYALQGSKGVVVGAPTHRATSVIHKTIQAQLSDSEVHRVSKRTLHRSLHLEFDLDEDTGEARFTNARGARAVAKEMFSSSLIVIDEASMIGDRLWDLLQRCTCRGIKVLLMGDPYQVFPVQEAREDGSRRSRVFDTPAQYTMDQVVRQDGVLLQEINGVRASIGEVDSLQDFDVPGKFDTLVQVAEDDLGSITHIQDKKEVMPLLKSMIDEGKDAVLLAYTKKVVEWSSNWIRKQYHDIDFEREALVEGETLVLQTGGTDHAAIGGKYLPAALEIEIDYCEHAEDWEIPHTIGVTKCGKAIRVLLESSKKLYQEKLLDYLEDAQQEQDSDLRKAKWTEYATLLSAFVTVRSPYVSTVHQAQGGTWENVIVIENSVMSTSDARVRRRLLYTAYSRSSRNLYTYLCPAKRSHQRKPCNVVDLPSKETPQNTNNNPYWPFKDWHDLDRGWRLIGPFANQDWERIWKEGPPGEEHHEQEEEAPKAEIIPFQGRAFQAAARKSCSKSRERGAPPSTGPPYH